MNVFGRRLRRDMFALIVFALILLAIGLFQVVQLGGYEVSDLTGGIITFNTLVRIGIFTIVIVGLNLLMGYAGQVSLGQAAFYGLGAYASAILTTRAALLNLPPAVAEAWWWAWLAIIIGALFTGAFAYVVGRPILRLRGHYLAMATLGLGIMVFIVFRENLGFRANEVNLTGGFDGIFDIPRLRIGNFVFWPIERYYFLVWGLAVLAMWLALNMVNSRPGRALRAIHGSELAAETVGVDTAQFKATIFAISAVYASLAGSLFAHFQVAVSPAPFGFIGSLELVIMAAVGGMGTVWGAPLGVAIILMLEELLRARLHLITAGSTAEIEAVVFGLLLILIMIFLPDGIMRAVINRWQRRKGASLRSDRAPAPGQEASS